MTRPNLSPAPGSAPRVLYGITSGTSARTLLRGQLAWLAARGWDVVLACTPDEDALAAASDQGVRLTPVPMERRIRLRSDLAALVAWVCLLRRERPDVVNVSTPKAGLLGGLAASLVRVPRRVYVVRGLRLEGSRGAQRVLLWLMERCAIAVATDVVVVSRSLGRECRRQRLFGRRGPWLIGDGSSNGVDAAAIAARAARVDAAGRRAELGLSRDDFVVGFVGRLTPDKGLDTLVRALADPRLPPRVRLLVIGSVEDPATASALGAPGGRIVSVGWTTDVWSYYAAMDALCLPTRREGFPNVVLEAAAAGIPAAVTRATGAIDAVEDGRTGRLFAVDDAAGLAAILTEWAEHPDAAAALGAAARDRVATRYRPERLWAGIEDILAGRGERSSDLRRL